MKLLFISQEHGLLPFAWRASRQGHEVTVHCAKPRFARAWEGRLPKLDVPADAKHGAIVEAVRGIVAETGTIVLSDSQQWTERLASSAS